MITKRSGNAVCSDYVRWKITHESTEREADTYQILLVRQILEIGITMDGFVRSGVARIAASILPPTQKHVQGDSDQREDVRSQDGADPKRVQGRLCRLEELRSDNVGDAVGDEHESVDGDFFRVSLMAKQRELRK